MPSTDYDDGAMRIGVRSFTRGWRSKLAVALAFAAAALIDIMVAVLLGLDQRTSEAGRRT